MERTLTEPVIILVPTGSLGAGVSEAEVAYAIARGAHVIATDAGSTDSGAAYLALGKSKNSHAAVKRDLMIMMRAAHKAGIPIVVGTSGQAGGDINLNWTRDIVVEVANELDIRPRIACLYSEQAKNVIKDKAAAGKVHPLAPMGPIDEATIDACDHIVAAMGPEPFIAAFDAGADIILGGRTTDTAAICCYALWKGAPAGPSWHAGKIGECGGQASVKNIEGRGILLRIDQHGFEVEALNDVNICTPNSVSAHMLYENSDPFMLVEPGGVLDVTSAHYEQVTSRITRVTGSVWHERPYTMKLEGASAGQYQTVMLIGIQDPVVLKDLPTFEANMTGALYERVHATMGEAAGDFHISLRIYGWNGTSGDMVPEDTPPPRDVGVLFVVTADTQDIADQIARACNPLFFHMYMPGHEGRMPSYGFAFSPAYIPRGQLYEFRLNHVVECEPTELVRTKWVDLTLEELA